MSTRKDAVKTSNTNISKKKVATKPSKRREESSERNNSKKTEVSLKQRSTNSLAEKKVDSVKNKINTKIEKPLKVQTTPHNNATTSSRKSTKPKVPITPPNRVSKTQYFPSKSLYTNALKVNDSMPKNTRDVSGDTSVKEKVSQKTIKAKDVANNKVKNKDTVKKPSPLKIGNKLNSVAEKSVIRSNTEVKKKTKNVSPDSSSTSERPRTATLRKGSIVNANIVGPDVPKQLVPKNKIKQVLKTKPSSPKSEASDQCNYEDDFESYESDFEEYFSSSSTNSDEISGEKTSSISSSSSSDEDVEMLTRPKPTSIRISSAGTDDERKLDSGNYDMPEFKHKQVLDNIRESIEKENLKLHDVQRNNNPASLSDEGFEDQKSLQFINFLDAKKKCERRKSMEVKRRRGEEILNMIRLDTYSFTLFDLAPVSYEVFIKNYGRHNTIQTGVQTGEDNVDESVQTEEITNLSKWTQCPIRFSKIDVGDPTYWQTYQSDYLGVGGDLVVEEKNNNKSFNESGLEKFLLSAGNLILKIQAESTLQNNGAIRKNTRDIPFSDGYILFDITKDILKNCSVSCISFYFDNSKILTVHSPKKQDTEDYKSVVCVWIISNAEEPQIFFTSYGYISCCCFGSDNTDFIYSGLNDGTISLWDLKKKIYNEDSSLKRSPLYTTGVGSGHTSKVVSLQPFISQSEKTPYFDTNQTNEICSLDEEGDIIIWSVIMKHSGTNSSNSTSWNDVVLAKNTRISLKRLYPELDDFRCTDFAVNTTDSNYVLVSTNYGFIIHHLIKGGRSNVKKFVPGGYAYMCRMKPIISNLLNLFDIRFYFDTELVDTSSTVYKLYTCFHLKELISLEILLHESTSIANCIELCPFSSNYILAGFDNGTITLYSRMVEKPIMVLSDKLEKLNHYGIEIVQWSKSKPFVIYTKDVNNTIHIWDLSESDIFPIYSVPFNQNITCMQLSPVIGDDGDQQSYMIIGTEDGKIYLHIFNKEHGPQPYQMYKEQLNTFIKYVNRL